MNLIAALFLAAFTAALACVDAGMAAVLGIVSAFALSALWENK